METCRSAGVAGRSGVIVGACLAVSLGAMIARADDDTSTTQAATQATAATQSVQAASQPTAAATTQPGSAVVVAATQPTTASGASSAATTQPAAGSVAASATQPTAPVANAVADGSGSAAAVAVAPAGGQPGNPAEAANAAKPAEPEMVRAVKARNFARQPKRVLEATHVAATTMPTTVATTPEARAEAFERDVLIGRWAGVAEFLAALPPAEAAPIYDHVLANLSGTRTKPMTPEEQQEEQMRQMQLQQMRNYGGGDPPRPPDSMMLPADVLAVADAYPAEPTPSQVALLGKMLTASLTRAPARTATLAAIEKGTRQFGGTDPAKRRRAAQLLMAANLEADARAYLPAVPADSNDFALLEEYVRVLVAAGDAGRKPVESGETSAIFEEYRRIYEMYGYQITAIPTQPAGGRQYMPQHAEALALIGRMLRIPTIDANQRTAAVSRAIALVNRVDPMLVDAFLRTLVADRPADAGAIVTSVAMASVNRMSSSDINERGSALKLQQRLVNLLLSSNADRATFKSAFDAMAMNWLAEVKATEAQPSMKERSRGGGERILQLPGGGMTMVSRNSGRQQTPSIDEATLLAAGPQQDGGQWLDACDPALRTAILRAVASLTIRDEQPVAAMEWVERLASIEPTSTGDLTSRLLRGWVAVANPNPSEEELEEQRRAQMYGYSSSQGGNVGIALTRVRQDRNLRELAGLLERMRKLPGGAPPIGAVADAFVKVHSQAEVFRPESIQAVFGPVAEIEPDALATLLTTMRQRLAQQWRQPQVQQQAGTKRDDKAIAAEVERGYSLILSAVQASHQAKTLNWRTETVAASALFDLNEFKYGRGLPLAEYTQRRDEAFARFKTAVDAYRAEIVAEQVKQGSETIEPFMNWFLAALGASDLAQLTRQQTPQTPQVRQIKDALAGLPGEAARRHLEMFASALSSQTKTISPELKYRYFRAAMDVVGDQPNAQAARDLVRYYDELLQEVQFVAQLDAPSTVVGTKPFGVHLGMRHTEAMGRESGGFGRYLTTPNAQQSYYYAQQSTGVKNDRDRTEKNLRESLSDSFEIVSITWHAADVTPRGDIEGRPGWRYTPLAFVLLKVKDASTDRVPPVRMDLDFRDGGSRVVLPIESSVVAIDAKTNPPAGSGGLTDVALAQTLDESELANGQLTLDIRASGNGLMPELADLVDLSKLAPWTIEKTGDGTLSVVGVDSTGDAVRPQTSRSWILTLKAPVDGKGATPASFSFPTLRDGIATAKDGVKYQRYENADLVATPTTIDLKPAMLARSRSVWGTALVVLAFLATVGVGLYAWLRRRTTGTVVEGSQIAPPADLTPFSVIAWLRRLESQNAFRGEPQALRAEIRRLEERYFGRSPEAEATDDFAAIAKRWSPA